MTSISPTSAKTTSSQQAASTAPLKTNMDYDSFLRLFMAQMKNQDPTKPNDPTATLSQLASFSNVEQSIRLNDKLQSLLSVSNAALAADIVGKDITSLDGSVSGTVASISSANGTLSASLENGQLLDLTGGYRIGAA